MEYNTKHGLSPQPLLKKKESQLVKDLNPYKVTTPKSLQIIDKSTTKQIKKMITHTKREMERMAKNLNFMEAARLRDELQELEKNLKNKA